MLTVALLIASGVPFFVGLALCATTLYFSLSDRARPAVARTTTVFGVILIAISATPVAAVLLIAGATATTAWLAMPHRTTSPRLLDYRQRIAALIAGIAVVGGLRELPHAWTPRVAETQRGANVAVIGDSLSAGIEDGVTVWPKLLATDTGLSVVSHAQAGASLAMALKQADAIDGVTDVTVLLIGGNDLLGGRTSADFERDLDALMARVRARCERIVMFELPTPPLGDGYVAAQRRLALRHGALLIPRWRLAAVLGTPGATTDGLHLSASGQRAIAEIVKWVLRRDGKTATEAPSLTLAKQVARTGPGAGTAAPAVDSLRVLTWNICKCERGIERIADVLRIENADIICLQELTEPRDGSTGSPHQTAELATLLGMNFASFGGPLDAKRNQCIAILSRWPLRSPTRLGSDPDRNWGTSADVETPHGDVRVVSVHLAGTYKLNLSHIITTTRARQRDWRELLETASASDGPLIIAGDFNADGRTLDTAAATGLRQLSGNEPTFPSRRPTLRLDHIFGRSTTADVSGVRATPCCSDHYATTVALRQRHRASHRKPRLDRRVRVDRTPGIPRSRANFLPIHPNIGVESAAN